MKGKIPLTEKMILESNESQWRLLTQGLINELKTSALIQLEPDRKVRIKLVIDKIAPPENTKRYGSFETTSSFSEEVSKGLARQSEFLHDFLNKNIWIFMGYIDGEEKTPILITYYTIIDMFIYTQKLATENVKDFLEIAKQN